MRGIKYFSTTFILIAAVSFFVAVFFLTTPGIRAFTAEAIPIGIYWDSNFTSMVDLIDWGLPSPGSSKTVTVYIRNEGNSAVRLSLNTTDWNPPEASEHISLDWNYTGKTITPKDATQISLRLSLSQNISKVTTFGFNIVVSAIEGEDFTISEFGTLFANNPSVRIIYPSESPDKPLGCVPAMVSDWAASAYVATKLEDYTEGLDTDSGFVNQATGYPIGEPGTGFVTFGGPDVNVPVCYYEFNKITPVTWCFVPGARGPGEPWSQWYLANGNAITETAIETSESLDLFVIEVFEDLDGRYTYLAYGTRWQGTYAAGKYFEKVVYPNLNSYTYSWIIVKWEDTNRDGFVNAPDDGDTYTLLVIGY